MQLPGGENAIVDIEKLRDYCLSATHPRGRHKSRVFAAALQITAADVELLRRSLLEAARDGEAVKGEEDEFGTRYTVDFVMSHGAASASIRSAWIVRSGENIPRLTSCWVLLS